MARGVGVQSPALSRFMRKITDIPRDIEKAMPVTYRRPLSSAVREAQNRAPKLTGALSSSIQHDEDSVYSTSPYALITEKGGSHPVWGRDPEVSVSPRPFLLPVIEDSSDEFMRANKEAVLLAARRAGFR